MCWLRFAANKFNWQVAVTLPDGSRALHEPPPETGTEVDHGELVPSAAHGLEQIDPFEVFFGRLGIVRLEVTGIREPLPHGSHQTVDKRVPCHPPQKIHVTAGWNETLEALETAEDRMMHASAPPRLPGQT